ncbi:DNA-3-methyladenine glycosylase family protein [Pelagovum pacificum]|uniref:DNA-3-methyladenine glycosylase II n=1 Tax=Pelagovum pacificum TaxID=2588711 RepID=A0A5C5GCU0_9RHOB|nr:DNA-3-methyladenine glycosylase [Pelagovum pacificum]QQA44577.1 DNA-3-methyladenine glycosylase 2 family protein [Pelagovum pacificum]TNY32310.1 DNA-3-methyladenine glycosylase 2 family protein [Pelagovum pacificum]
MTERVITHAGDVEEGAAWLARAEPRFAALIAESGPPPLKLRDEGFRELLFLIIGQQVSTASALAIRARADAAGLTTPEAVKAASDELLREVGLTRPKQRYFRALAEAKIDYAALRELPTDQVIATLTAVPGIGPWTAEIYAMLSLGRADVFAPADVALQEGTRMLFDLPARPTARALRDMSEAWSPWRSVAAWALWAYYLRTKGREVTW